MNKVHMEQPGLLSTAQKSHLLSFSPAPAPVDFSPHCLPPPGDHHHPAAAPAVAALHVWTPRKAPSSSAPMAAAAPDMMDIPWHHHPSTTGGLCWPEEHPGDLSAFHPPSLFKSDANDALHRAWSSISEGAAMSQPKNGSDTANRAINAPLASEDSGGNTAPVADGLNLMKGNSSSFPLSVVSGPRAIPFACKLDASAIEVRDVGFVSLAGYSDDSDSSYKNAPESAAFSAFPAVKVELDDSLDGKSVQGHGLSSRGEQKSEAAEVKKEIQLKLGSAPDNLSGGSTVAASGDGTMGLKLGKRTYFEDGAVSTLLGESSGRMSTSNGNSNINSSSSTHAGTSKKQKSSPPASFPRCQAEGCKADLSGAKDYHRRHKVCECHSKASKVKVANVEQRFCQQCSRFHLLSEFDEGKRSCRRRLAGHNERRRKPQPEPMSLLSSGTFAYFSDANHLLNGSVLDYPCFLQHKRASVAPSLDAASLACHFGLLAGAPDHTPALKLLPMPKESMSSNFPALELHHFVEGTSGGLLGGGGGGLQPRNALLTAGGNALALSNPPGMSSSPPSSATMGLISMTEPQPPSEIAISGRALSLLSSSLGSSNNPCSMSMSLAIPSSSPIQQLLSENHQAARHAFPPLSFDAVNNMNAMAANSPSVNTPSIGGEPAAAVPDCLNMLPPTSLHKSLQTSSSGRPILDLMSMESHTHYHYTDFEGLSMFGRQNII